MARRRNIAQHPGKTRKPGAWLEESFETSPYNLRWTLLLDYSEWNVAHAVARGEKFHLHITAQVAAKEYYLDLIQMRRYYLADLRPWMTTNQVETVLWSDRPGCTDWGDKIPLMGRTGFYNEFDLEVGRVKRKDMLPYSTRSSHFWTWVNAMRDARDDYGLQRLYPKPDNGNPVYYSVDKKAADAWCAARMDWLREAHALCGDRLYLMMLERNCPIEPPPEAAIPDPWYYSTDHIDWSQDWNFLKGQLGKDEEFPLNVQHPYVTLNQYERERILDPDNVRVIAR